MTRTRTRTRALLASVAVPIAIATTTASTARADDKEQCVAASEQAQTLKDEGKLRAARSQLLACARDVCPGIVRKDCDKWRCERTPQLRIDAGCRRLEEWARLQKTRAGRRSRSECPCRSRKG